MKTRTVHIFIGLLLTGTFLVDSLTPLGHQEFVLYALPILFTLWLEGIWAAYVVAGVATVLVYAGLVLSPPGIPVEVALLNRTLTAALFWIVAVLVNRSREAILDRGARQFAALVDSSVDAIISQDLTGAVTTWNVSAERMFGYRSAEMIGQTLSTLIPSDRARQEIHTHACIRHGESVAPYETVWKDRDGRLIELSLSLSPILNRAGEVIGISTIAHDITPLKLAVRTLREHEDRLNLVVSATRTGVWDWDLRANTMYYSPRWKESLGYGPNELTDSPSEWETRLHPEDRDRAVALVQAYLAGEILTYELEHRLRHRDGTYRWIHTDAVLRRDETGVAIRMTGSHVDVTDHKLAQEALQQSEGTLHAFFESASLMMGVVEVLDDDIRHLSSNRATAQFFRTTQDAMNGRTASELGAPQEAIRLWLHHYRLCIKEQSPVRFEYEHRDERGGKSERRSLLATVSLIGRGADGTARCSFVVDDVTEWRKAEDLLREAHATLELRVAERTTELGNATVRARTLAQRLFDVQEAERRAVAQDLHDEIGQVLTALKLNLQQVQRDGQGAGSSMELNESIEISDQLLARVRNLALDLRPSLLDDLGLVPALRWYATRQAERAGWTLRMCLDEIPVTLSAPSSIAYFRVVQEAMTNIARHARARWCFPLW